jgi:hypothetical protein
MPRSYTRTCQENQNFGFGMRNLNDYQKRDGYEFSYGQFLSIFIEKQFCTSDKNGATAALHQEDTGVCFVSDTTRDIYCDYMRFKSFADVLCSRTIFFVDNLKLDDTLSRRQVQCCTAWKKIDLFQDCVCVCVYVSEERITAASLVWSSQNCRTNAVQGKVQPIFSVLSPKA